MLPNLIRLIIYRKRLNILCLILYRKLLFNFLFLSLFNFADKNLEFYQRVNLQIIICYEIWFVKYSIAYDEIRFAWFYMEDYYFIEWLFFCKAYYTFLLLTQLSSTYSLIHSRLKNILQHKNVCLLTLGLIWRVFYTILINLMNLH